MKYTLKIYLCLAYSISSPPMSMLHKHPPWSTNDMIHFISSCSLIGHRSWPHLLYTIAFIHGAKSCSSFTTTRSIASKPLTCPSCLQLVCQAKPCLDLLHLVTWLNVMSHMQWAPSSHLYMWTNFLCISHKYILVHLGCHLITKTKQEPFNWPLWIMPSSRVVSTLSQLPFHVGSPLPTSKEQGVYGNSS
jgi:hypothetical protein